MALGRPKSPFIYRPSLGLDIAHEFSAFLVIQLTHIFIPALCSRVSSVVTATCWPLEGIRMCRLSLFGSFQINLP
jgi:hypothetical protein